MGDWTRRRRRSAGARVRGSCFGLVLLAALGVTSLDSCAPPTGILPGATVSAIPADIDLSGRVTRIADGDTFWIDSRSVRIRVWGLDAPETDQPGGSAATAALARLIAGHTLRCR